MAKVKLTKEEKREMHCLKKALNGFPQFIAEKKRQFKMRQKIEKRFDEFSKEFVKTIENDKFK